MWESLSCFWCFWCFLDTLSLLQPSELRCVSRLFLQLPSLSRLGVDFCACSPRPRLGSVLSPGPFYHSGLGKTSVPLVMSSLFDILHVILHLTERGPGLWYSSRAANLSHSSLPAGFRWSHCENCVVRIELVRLVLVDDDTFPDDRGELWVASLAILACCRSAPAATAVLNSWNSVSCLKSSLFSSIILASNVWSIPFFF